MRRVLKEALGNNVSDFKLLVFIVHNVVLEFGFSRINKDSDMAVSFFHLLYDSVSAFILMISWRYTLPKILVNGASHSVNLKFQTLGPFMSVCGSLSDDTRLRFQMSLCHP